MVRWIQFLFVTSNRPAERNNSVTLHVQDVIGAHQWICRESEEENPKSYPLWPEHPFAFSISDRKWLWRISTSSRGIPCTCRRSTRKERDPDPWMWTRSLWKMVSTFGMLLLALMVEQKWRQIFGTIVANWAFCLSVPSEAPQEVHATPLSSQSIMVIWSPPPLQTLHGILQGYKVFYKPVRSFQGGPFWHLTWCDFISKNVWILKQLKGESEKRIPVMVSDKNLLTACLSDNSMTKTEMTSKLTTILQGLEKYVNYSIQVLAFTRMGDGIQSQPLYIRTQQDGNCQKFPVVELQRLYSRDPGDEV